MTHREVELLAIGAGPSNLALAVALEELAPEELAGDSLVIDRADSVVWQPGLMLPWARSQISFLKDLVTRRNPGSKYSFVNFLHLSGRLNDFINLGSFTPFRVEISEYFAWVAGSLDRVRVELGRECVSIEPRRDAGGRLVGWTTGLADGSTIASRVLVLAAGRDPYIPPVFAGLSPDRIVHSTRYSPYLASLDRSKARRVAVIGSAQSAAEMFRALQDDLPGSEIDWIVRAIGLPVLQSSRFTNEIYFPSFVDRVYGATPERREQIRREVHRTMYSGISPDLIDTLYDERYVARLNGRERAGMTTFANVVAAREEGEEVVLELEDRGTGEITELRRDLVFLGTGFSRAMPARVRRLAGSLGLDRISVNRQYRLELDEPTDAACYLQGVNELTHGISDSLLSVLPMRSADTVRDIVARRPTSGGLSVSAVTQPAGAVPEPAGSRNGSA
jgi:L-ornithine N5-oxygenase